MLEAKRCPFRQNKSVCWGNGRFGALCLEERYKCEEAAVGAFENRAKALLNGETRLAVSISRIGSKE